MAIYIDNEFKCYTSDAAGRKEVELSEFAAEFFDGKSNDFIEGYRYVPQGETWTRKDGKVFEGEMISPWKNALQLERIQAEYEREQLAQTKAELADADAALAILGVNVDA